MLTGSDIAGTVAEFDFNSLVVELDDLLSAIGWEQVMPDDACRTLSQLLVHQRQGRDRLTPTDHIELGKFALKRNRTELAKRHFALAARNGEDHRQLGESALRRHARFRRGGGRAIEFAGPTGEPHTATDEPHTASQLEESIDSAEDNVDASLGQPQHHPDESESDAAAHTREKITTGYRKVGLQISDGLSTPLSLVETEHFLIWTDWSSKEHDLLRLWCESAYRAVLRQLGRPSKKFLFAGKCPVFCMRSRKSFLEVAKLLDDYDVSDALGYARSDSNGHVHVVVCRQGGSEVGLEAFASTLVHETVHACMHRVPGPAALPGWVSEGLANYLAEVVLGDRCSNGETAAAIARQFIARNLELDEVFDPQATLDARYYPVAHSLVHHLITREPAAFAGFLTDLKNGQSVDTALRDRYELDRTQLEQHWRAMNPASISR